MRQYNYYLKNNDVQGYQAYKLNDDKKNLINYFIWKTDKKMIIKNDEKENIAQTVFYNFVVFQIIALAMAYRLNYYQ